ncbi:putative nucleotidyltransferase, ribonuclease H [Tanacetum coccineum]
MLENGFIRPCVSLGRARSYVKKKGWEHALCIDYRELNRSWIFPKTAFRHALWPLRVLGYALQYANALEESMRRHLRIVLEIFLDRRSLYAKFSKWSSGYSKSLSLSYCFCDGNIMDPSKVKSITKWPTHTTGQIDIRWLVVCYAVGDFIMWEMGCDFLGFSLLVWPTTQKRFVANWVVVDRLTKSAIFFTIRKELLVLGVWDEYLCLVEFAYNNSWHASIKAAPFELLYGRKCRAPICWDEVGERLIEGPELIEITNEKVAVAKEKLKEARSRQKSYADKHRRDLEFQVGDRVFLKVSPFRGVKRFGIKGKLSPRFIGPFEILERIGEVSYRLALPPQLSHVHDVFHVSLLRGYHYHPLHVASYPFDQIQPDMSLSEEPESILDRQERVMRNKVIPFVKILWKNHPEREATWETEESMRASYPHFFV